jgi:hypothetical protein
MDPNRALLQVFSFLRVNTRPVQAVTKKNTHDNLREVILNFDEVRANYVNTKYEHMFDEVLV